MDIGKLVKEIIGNKAFKVFIIIAMLSLAFYNISFLKRGILFALDKILAYPFSIVGITFIIGLVSLLKISNYKSNKYAKEDWDNSNKPFKIYSNTFNGIYFMLIDNYKVYEKKENYIVFRIINNNDELTLKKVEGKITLYTNSTEAHYYKIFEKKFSVNDLNKKTEFQILTVPITADLYNWSFFEVELNRMHFDDNSQYKDIRLRSERIYKNTAWILNHIRLYEHNFLLFKTKYNLKWLKDKLRELKSFLRFQCSTKVYLGFNPSKEMIIKAKKDYRTKWLYRICFGVIFLVLTVLISYSLLQLVQLIFVILQKLGEVISDTKMIKVN